MRRASIHPYLIDLVEIDDHPRLVIGKCLEVHTLPCKFLESVECRVNGAWDALLQTPVDLGLTDDWQHMIDTTARGHASAVGANVWLAPSAKRFVSVDLSRPGKRIWPPGMLSLAKMEIPGQLSMEINTED